MTRATHERRLNHEQQGCLRALREYGGWLSGTSNCGWHWNGVERTKRILDGLVRRGLVERHGNRYNAVG
jgi:hypothetical protein